MANTYIGTAASRPTTTNPGPRKLTNYEKKSVYWNLYDAGMKRGELPWLERKANKWYQDEAKKVLLPTNAMEIYTIEKDFKRRGLTFGALYQWHYPDPKYKNQLRMWDECPLVLPFEQDSEHIWAFNLHYLEPRMRARLFDRLQEFATTTKYNDNQKLALSYNMLKGAAKYAQLKPTIHCYLKNRIKSPYYKIPATYWPIALFLKTERFHKMSKTAVWADSSKKIKKGW